MWKTFRPTTSPKNTAASSASTGILTRPGSPSSASTPCSTGARSPAASSPATANGSASTGAWGWCSEVFDQPRPGVAAGAPGHRPRALLHHRLHQHHQRPALRGAARRPDHRHRPQRHPDQRPADSLPPGSRGLHLPVHHGHGSHRPPHGPAPPGRPHRPDRRPGRGPG